MRSDKIVSWEHAIKETQKSLWKKNNVKSDYELWQKIVKEQVWESFKNKEDSQV